MPTLVEVKRGANPEIRRKVVGQMLDYAAHAPRSWTADELRDTFEANPDHSILLRNLLKDQDDEDEPDADAFWKDVATNLAAKNLRLLFVADKVPDELARVVEFLNEQMPRIEVLAVEIQQFRGKSSQTLVPRVIGRTAASDGKNSTPRKRTRMTHEKFIAGLPSEEVREATERLFRVARGREGKIVWGDRGLSIRATSPTSLWQGEITVAWMYPPSDGTFWMGLKDYSFGTSVLRWSSTVDERLHSTLQRYTDEFSRDEFTKDLWGTRVVWTVAHDDVVKHIDLLADRLDRVLADLRAL